MKPRRFSRMIVAVCASLLFVGCTIEENPIPKSRSGSSNTQLDQVPGWSRQDLDFFLHGSMSTEFVPETVLRAFVRIYPDLFPSQDFSHFGLLPDQSFG